MDFQVPWRIARTIPALHPHRGEMHEIQDAAGQNVASAVGDAGPLCAAAPVLVGCLLHIETLAQAALLHRESLSKEGLIELHEQIAETVLAAKAAVQGGSDAA